MDALENEYREIITLEDFPLICRICCMRRSDLRVFEEEEGYLFDLFHGIRKIDVRSAIKYPRNICTDCGGKIKEISSFIKISKKNDSDTRSCKNLNSSEELMGYQIESGKLQKTLETETFHESQTCRICLSLSSTTQIEEKAHLMELFQNITSIDLRAASNSSGKYNICNKCIDNLEGISSFINLSLSSDDKFDNAISGNEVVKTQSNSNPTEFECIDDKSDAVNADPHANKENFQDICIEKEYDDKLPTSSGQSPQKGLEFHSRALSENFDGRNETVETENYSDQTINELSVATNGKFESVYIKEEINDAELAASTTTFRCERPFKCDHCEKSFTQRSYLKRHMLTHTGIKPFECDHCTRRFLKRSDLKRHSLTHTGEKPYECEFCKKCFSQSYSLQQHLLLHTGEKPFKCDSCEKSFTRNTYLQHHLITHTGATFQCNQCDLSFTQQLYLQRHMQVHSSEKPFKCGFCEKGFSQKCYLKKHSLIHTGEKPYECDNCKKSFLKNSDLKRHLLTHSGEKLYKCDLCEKRFTQPSGLQQHRVIHTGEKRYKCDSCEKCFSRRGYLLQHMLIHKEKQFKCDCCTRSFSRKSSLQLHVLTHNGGKQFECDCCSRKFNHASSLQRHLLNHATERSFECGRCEKTFSRKDYLQEHLLIHKC